MAVGTFNTSNFATDLAVKSFSELITRLMPNGQATLFGLTSMLKTETCLSTTHSYFSKTMLFPEVTINASQLAGDTTLTVVSSANMLPGMVLRNQTTGEAFIVNSAPTGTTITVTRAIGTVAAAAMAATQKCYQIGNAYEEGSTRPSAQNLYPTKISNVTQIFRNSWALTDTVRAVQMAAGDTNIQESKQDCVGFHAVDIEKALFFGQKFEGTRNNMPFRTMDGLYNTIATHAPTNINAAGATTNYTQLENLLNPVFNTTTDPKTSNERLLFVGSTSRVVINNIGRLNGQYQMVDGQTNYGLQFQTFKTTRGTFRLIEHPLLNSNTDWAKMAFAVDLPAFNLAYLNDRKTQHKSYNAAGTEIASDNGIDSVGGTLTTECTMLLKNPSACAVITGFTAAAVG
jgi:hypothetical protein